MNHAVFRITGPKNGVMEAVQRMTKRHEGTGSLSWRYHRQYLWKLIGNKGVIVKRIQNVFKCKVHITPEEVPSDQLLVTCTGPLASQERVKIFYDRVITGSCKTEEDEEDGGLTWTSVFAPSIMFGKIIGTRGAQIAGIREDSGATVEIEPGSHDSYMREILIVGHLGQISRAKFLIDQQLCKVSSFYLIHLFVVVVIVLCTLVYSFAICSYIFHPTINWMVNRHSRMLQHMEYGFEPQA